MSRIINYTTAVTVNPSSYSGGTNNYVTGGTSGCSSVSNTSTSRRATIRLRTNGQYVSYLFNLSEIPSNASINSVSCSARAQLSSSSRRGTIQLYNGTAAKGTATTVNSTASTEYSISAGSWTRSELNNINLRITNATGSTNNSYYVYFYGADLTVNYTVNGVEYEVTATSEYNGASVSPSSQFILQGEDAIVRIDTDTLDNMVLEDNGVDATDSLQYVAPQAGTLTFTAIPSSFDYTNSVYDTSEGTNGVYDTNYIDNGLTNHTSTTRAAIYATKGSNADTYIYYNFDCSEIPRDATITSVSCQVKAGNQGTNYYSSNYRQVQLCAGTTTKGSSQSVTGSNTSPTTVTVNGGSSWTRAELDDIKIRYWVRRGTSNTSTGATISFYGATLTVQYTLPQEPYYQYTISNVSADHDVVFKQAVIVPPEEEPNKTYYSLTISSINATTEPGRGTIRVESGSTETIKIYPTDPQLTLTTDNGTNISSQLVYHAGSQPTYEVSTAQGASYGFNLNTGTGYYVSQNTGVDKSAAVSKIDFDLPVSCLVTFQFINYAEATYDFGVFGNIDATLSNNYYAAGSNGATITDSNYRLACNTSTHNTSSVQTLTYEIPAGQHYIYVKYSKDDGSSSNNDSLQWKISNIEPLSPVSGAYYEYTLSNINQNHSLIFIFGDVTYYFVTSTHDGNGRLYPDGQTVCLPGDIYKLTIVPETPEDTVTASDNNVDVTNSLERKEIVIEKNGQSALTVNYIYTISNVQTAHTISVHDSSAVRYAINASSTYAGATVSPSSQNVEEGDDAVVSIAVNNAYEIKVKDNGTDVTSSLVNGGNGYIYTINNVQSAHTIVVEEAAYYTVTGSSTYTGATVNAPGKVYVGQTATVTVSVANKYEIVFKDNNVDKTSSLVGETTTLTYTLTNVQGNHTIAVSEATNYTISTSSSYNGVTATANPTKVYAGRSCTVTITGASANTMVVKDNNVDVTSSLVGSNNSYTYTLPNVSANHTITVTPITYAVNASSTFAGATITPTSSTVIKGNSLTLTINSPNTYSIRVTDNNTDVTSSLTGSANNYKYTISNITTAHTVVVSEAPYYTVSGTSSYNGATISAPGKVYAGQNATVTVSVGNKYEIVFKDNNVDKTSSLVGSTGTLTYSLTNVQADHSITITEATYYAVTGTSSYAGVTATASPTKVYAGQSSVVTINAVNKYQIKVFDNGTNVTSSVTGSSGAYKYNLTNVQSAHTVTVQENDYYTVSVNSTYTGATATTSISKVYVGQTATATITVTVPNKYEVIIKDNNVDKTSSLTGSNGTFTYTTANIAENHTIVVSEGAYYTVTTSSNYTGATISASPTKIYTGQSTRTSELTLSVANLYEVVVKDNGTVITNSFTGSNGTYHYTLTNISADHTITVGEGTFYDMTVSSTYSRAGISANPTRVYAGESTVITITGDTVPIKVLDNGTDITSSFTKNGTTLTYTLTNVQTAHTITVSFVQTAMVRTSGGYVAGKKFYKKTAASTWTEMTLSEFQSYIQSNDVFYD